MLVVDCAPTGETLRLLSFPDVCTWWLEKVFPWQGKWLAAARPFARDVLDVPLPPDGVLADVERLVRNMVAMNAILRDPALTTVRLVMTPDRMVVREAMRTFTYLNLYGYLTDAVVVNRILPEAMGDTYFSEWLEAQREQMEAVRSAFAPVPILTAPYLPREVMGETMLDGLGDEIFGELAADAVLHKVVTQELTTGDGRATLRLLLPFAERGDVELKKIGLEVIVKVAGQKRTIILPPAMAAYETSGARLENGALEVSFERSTDGAPAQHTS